MSKSTSNHKTIKNTIASSNVIEVKGAKVHNLKNISVQFPRNKLIVVTGVSGSGKSSLTIDTLFAEGQRRYAESLSAYARQFMSRMVKPDVDDIVGLCPAIAIEQKVVSRTPRSSVGSMTEIYDYLRLLYAKIGKTISPISQREVKKQTEEDVAHYIQTLPQKNKVFLLFAFPNLKHRKLREELELLLQKGFSRLVKVVNKELEKWRIEDIIENEQAVTIQQDDSKNWFVVIDRLVVKKFEEEEYHRIKDSISIGFFEGLGQVHIFSEADGLTMFNNAFELDGIKFEEPVPNLFSFNNPLGACPTCEGFGQVLGIDPDLVIPNKNLSVYDDAVAPWRGEKLSEWKRFFISQSKSVQFPIHKPINQLTKEEYRFLWKGNYTCPGIDAFFKEVEANLYKVQYRVLQSRYRGKTNCPTCEGYKLKPEALYVKIQGKHIGELTNMPINDLKEFIDNLSLTDYEKKVSVRIMQEIEQRLNIMQQVGLGYLTLGRTANTLSGGESQRIQLTRSLGSNLTDSLYILDEPSIGLHNRDTANLIQVLKSLRNLGNTVIVVEHDEMMMKEADHIIDMGPLAAHLGGEVIAEGDYDSIIKNKQSLTGQYLSKQLTIEKPASEIKTLHKFIHIEGVKHNNLKNINVSFPLHCLCVVSGVSGSGKTTLVKQVLYPALCAEKGLMSVKPGMFTKLHGHLDAFTMVEMIDQNPIGKSSRSNPVTYIKAYDAIRELFAEQHVAKTRGYRSGTFSFNIDGGRCDTCKGEGEQLVEMQFLADVHLTCESCKGKRFKDDVLEVTYREKNIADVLMMSVDEAIHFFEKEKNIVQPLQCLQSVGLGYIKLGQSSDTLSGGEAQRVKLAFYLNMGKNSQKHLFIFDEPTTGLHFHDIQKLLQSFQALINQGHSLIVIEHNSDVIKQADWVIDLGPEAGNLGGELVFAGTPTNLKKYAKSITAQYL